MLFSKTTRKNVARVLTVMNQKRKFDLRKKVRASNIAIFSVLNAHCALSLVQEPQVEAIGFAREEDTVKPKKALFFKTKS